MHHFVNGSVDVYNCNMILLILQLERGLCVKLSLKPFLNRLDSGSLSQTFSILSSGNKIDVNEDIVHWCKILV